MKKEWFDSDCPICKALMNDNEGDLELPDGWELVEFEELDVDIDSNHVGELIRSGRLDDAENAARELLDKYPDQVDGVVHLAAIFEARGDFALAIQYHECAIAFSHTNDGFDEVFREYHRERIEALKKLLPGAGALLLT